MGGGKGDALEATTEDLLGAAPDVDRLEMARVRARAARRLFGDSAPVRLGRYEVGDRIGDGGMGMVYDAFDPQLQRKVALKVLHPRRSHDARAQERMVVEARALAKLDHPNIVKVYDALVETGQVVLVMELLEGETLELWQTREPRTWREVVEIYAQAGEGLAAAHGVEVIHRDFKPSNAIVGVDGRVRVLDFGLARLADADEMGPDGAPSESAPHLTATGDVLGTLAFSSPEQLAGQTATAASDQFSFCVALHLALEGTSPFSGSVLSARRASIEAGVLQRAGDGRRIPPWLHALIARGLSLDPEARHGSMRALVHELRRSRGWRRWRVPMLGASAVAIAITSTALVSGGAEASTCDGGAALVEEVWNDDVRGQIRTAIDGSGSPYGIEIRDRVLAALDRTAAGFADTHGAACKAHQRGEISNALLDRQMTCLARRLGSLRAATRVLAEVDATSLPNAMDVATAIPDPSTCADLELLQSDVEPPSTPVLRFQVDGLRARISEAEALARAGRAGDALSRLGPIRDAADHTPYPPVQVEAALAEGRIRIGMSGDDSLRAAIRVLSVARKLGLEHQILPVAIEAEARIIYAEGALAPDLGKLERELEVVLPLSAGLHDDHFTRPLLLNNVGTVYLAAGKRGDAARYFRQARAALGGDPPDLELLAVDRNLAMLTVEAPEREAMLRRVWERQRDVLGEQHLTTLFSLYVEALYTVDPRIASDLLARALDGYRRFHPGERFQIAQLLARRAFLAVELGNHAQAIRLYRDAITSMPASGDADIVRWRHLCAGELALLLDEPKQAVAELEGVYRAKIDSPFWWERADALRAATGLGQAYAVLRSPSHAMEYLEQADRSYQQLFELSQAVEYQQCLARVRRARGSLHGGPHE